MIRKITFFVLIFAFLTVVSCKKSKAIEDDNTYIEIPLQGNTYVTSGVNIVNYSDGKIGEWNKKSTILSAYFRVMSPFKLKIALKYTASDTSLVRVTCQTKVFDVKFVPGIDNTVDVGEFENMNGYIRTDFQGLSASGSDFGSIKSIIISGEISQDDVLFITNNYYWGLRGPMAVLYYILPNDSIEWFYNEVTVPLGNDPVGSYFVANGFNGGYFGIQVNSPTERRVLFSVWSPYKTDNPEEIPANEQVLLNRKGDNVISQAFGHEGSGRQNFKIFPWKAGTTYKFLTQVLPDPERLTYTKFTCWIYDPDSSKWLLVASNSRPKTNTYYSGAYSFSENFIPANGYIVRKALFSNMWAITAAGEWKRVNQASFTCATTVSTSQRMDYKGGIEDNKFFLQNCGFFSDYTSSNLPLLIIPLEDKPDIDFAKLP